MIQIDENTIYMIGGWRGVPTPIWLPDWECPSAVSKKTWIINPNKIFELFDGPPLNEGRAKPSCAKMEINGNVFIVIAGGCGGIYYDGHLMYGNEPGPLVIRS